MKRVIQVKQKHAVLVILVVAVCFLVVAAFVLLLPDAEARQIGSYESVRTYTYETIVDMEGGYSGELPADIPGTIVGVSVAEQSPSNRAWYPVVFNSTADDDNIAIVVAFGDRDFNGYFKHNEDNWAPIQEHIGNHLRIVIFVRD
jgi:hypothetical protein